jgi:hypothetical protein
MPPALRAFIGNTQTTHNKNASASIAAFLDFLAKKYLSDQPTEEAKHAKLQQHIDVFGNYINDHPEFKGDNALLEAIASVNLPFLGQF